MINAVWAIIAFLIATFAAIIPGVRNTRPIQQSSSLREKGWFYLRKYKKYIAITGGLLGAIAAFVGSVEQENSQNLLVQRSDTISGLNKKMLQVQTNSYDTSIKQYEKLLNQDEKINKLQKEIAAKSDEYAKKVDEYSLVQKNNATKIITLQDNLIKKAEENANLNKQLADLSTETLNNIIGKDSYCYVEMHISPMHKKAFIYVHHIGQYALKNVQIFITNTDREYQATYGIIDEKFDFKNNEKYHTLGSPFKYTIPVISPNDMLAIGDIEVSDQKQKSFNICFKADNNGSTWFQRIVLRQVAAYPEDFYLSETDKNIFLWASQLYKIKYRSLYERLQNEKTSSYRTEIMISEGTNGFFNSIDLKNKRYENLRWRSFPKMIGETNPFFDIHKLHVHGEPNGYIIHAPVIIEY